MIDLCRVRTHDASAKRRLGLCIAVVPVQPRIQAVLRFTRTENWATRRGAMKDKPVEDNPSSAVSKAEVHVTKFRCRECGKIGAGRVPLRGDGTLVYPRKHKGANGEMCNGVRKEADWIDVVSADPKTATEPQPSVDHESTVRRQRAALELQAVIALLDSEDQYVVEVPTKTIRKALEALQEGGKRENE